MPERLTPLSVATPEPLVAGLPTLVPLSVKLIVLPLMAALVLAFLSVAVNVTVPPNVPVAGSTVSAVAVRFVTAAPLLVACFPSPPWYAPVSVAVEVLPGLYVTEQLFDAPLRVQEVGVKVPEPPDLDQLTFPVGVLCVPGLVSVTVAVHVLAVRLAVTGKFVQLTIVLVVRRAGLNAALVPLLPLWFPSLPYVPVTVRLPVALGV